MLGSTRVRGDYFAVPTTTLRVNELVDFDLYLPSALHDHPVLYREQQLPFDDEARQRLARQGVAELWIRNNDEAAYQAYVEAHLKDLLCDPSIPLEAKSEMLYSSAQFLVKDVLSDPRAGDVISRSGNLVEAMVGHMLREPSAFASLMRITSYDYYTYTHSVNVCVFSLSLARRVGFNDEKELRRFGIGALLHDVGKSRIDDSVLNVRGKLSPEQWNIMRKHPVYGHEILIDQRVQDRLMLTVTRHHHEKLTGNGYPDGLEAREIEPLVRITTIADIFDALTTRRSYKSALTSFPALKLMREQMSDELDRDFFRVFIEMLGKPE